MSGPVLVYTALSTENVTRHKNAANSLYYVQIVIPKQNKTKPMYIN